MLLHSVDSEEMLVGSLMSDASGSLYAEAIKRGATPEIFWHAHTRAIYEAIVEIVAKGDPLSGHSVMMRLKQKGDQRVPDGVIEGMVANYEGSLWMNSAFREVFHLYRQRCINEAFKRGSVLTERRIEFGEIENVIAPILDAVGDVTAKRREHVTVEEVGTTLRAKIEREINALPGADVDDGLTWGIHDMDRTFGKIKEIELVVVGAAPSHGKSSLMRQVASANLKKGKRIVMFSLEVGIDAVLADMASESSGYCRRNLRDQAREKQEAWLTALDEVTAMSDRLAVYDSIYSGHTMEATIRTGIAGGFRPDLIAVDYLQIMEMSSKKGSNKASDIGDVTRRMKLWTKMFRCPVVLLSQLNREGTKGERAPRKTDLRDSGSIEADADRIILIHRPSKDRDGNPQENSSGMPKAIIHCEIIQDKYRDGVCGSLNMDFVGPIKTFRSPQ
jgi:replicative DNA helicase